jgi:type III secretion protein Q
MSYPADSLVLARLARDAALACRCIARQGKDLDVTIRPREDAGALPSTWRVTFAPGQPYPDAQTERIHAILEWEDAALRVCIPRRACSLWLAARFPDLDIGPLPAPMLDAAIEAIAGDIAASLDTQEIPASIRVLAHGKGSAAVQWPHVWTLCAHSPALRDSFAATLEMNDAALARLAHALSRCRPVANTLDPDETPVVLRAVLGSTSISARCLGCCGVGDVILLDRYLVDGAGTLWLATPDGQAVQVQAQRSRFVIIQGWTSIMNDSNSIASACGHAGAALSNGAASHDALNVAVLSINHDPLNADAMTIRHDASNGDAAPVGNEALDVDAISIGLSFDVGERHIKLGDLRALQPGEIFDLDRPLAEGYVYIRANGAIVGWGELVDIDGRVGVRILGLGHNVP